MIATYAHVVTDLHINAKHIIVFILTQNITDHITNNIVFLQLGCKRICTFPHEWTTVARYFTISYVEKRSMRKTCRKEKEGLVVSQWTWNTKY
jgi:hypothetical protein